MTREQYIYIRLLVNLVWLRKILMIIIGKCLETKSLTTLLEDGNTEMMVDG